ncbi:PaaI family thioesterase [Psychrobacillus sp. NPDC093180]|uniref:PaaI family thioesterase n=1 Tax=Psychrobacillus sp. NPDC093180 TaxID=3364489 RepID=UPI003808A524
MNELQSLLHQVAENASEADMALLKDFLIAIQKKQQNTSTTYLNAVLQMDIQFEQDTCIVTFPITPLSFNTFDKPHGGIIATVMDNAMGYLVNKDLRPEGKGAVTTNMNIHYVKAATQESLIATASYLHKGRQTLVLECSVTQPDGKRIAHATGSFFVINPPDSSK